MLISPAYAQSAAAGGSLFELLFPLVMVFAIIYFMILRPQQKRQREHTTMIEALRRGDTVVTQQQALHPVLPIEVQHTRQTSRIPTAPARVAGVSSPTDDEPEHGDQMRQG